MRSPAVSGRRNSLSPWACSGSWLTVYPERIFPTPLDFLSEENGLVGCSKTNTLQLTIQNYQQPLQNDLRRLPPGHDVVHSHQKDLVDVPIQHITHRHLETSGSVQHPVGTRREEFRSLGGADTIAS